MKIIDTALEGVKIIEPRIFGDDRGYFFESWNEKKFSEAVGVLNVALEFKHPKAVYALGCLYEFGRGVECDKRYAYELYNAAEKLSFKDTRSKYKSNILRMIKK